MKRSDRNKIGKDGMFEAGMQKQLNFCGSGSTLKKEAEANSEAFDFLRRRKHFS